MQKVVHTQGLSERTIWHALHCNYECLQAYSDTVPDALLEYVAQGRNCEDILMQYVVSSRSEAAPVFVWDMRWASRARGAAAPRICGYNCASTKHRCSCTLHTDRLAGAAPV